MDQPENEPHDENLHEPFEPVDPEVVEQQIAVKAVSKKDATRFYDRVRRKIFAYVDRKGHSLGKAAEYLLLVPDVFMLLLRLSLDDRVSARNKVLLGTGLAYFILPIDIVPEAIVGPIGFLDDLVLAVYILETMLVDTDEAILHEHWSGTDDVLDTIRKVLGAADSLVSKDFIARVKKWVS